MKGISVQAQLLAQVSQVIGRSPPLRVVLSLVLHERLEGDPPMPTNSAERDLAGFEQADDVGTRNIQHVSCLLGGELGILRDDLDTMPGLQQAENLGKHDHSRTRNHQCVIGTDLAEGLNQVFFRMATQVVADTPRGPACDLGVYLSWVN